MILFAAIALYIFFAGAFGYCASQPKTNWTLMTWLIVALSVMALVVGFSVEDLLS